MSWPKYNLDNELILGGFALAGLGLIFALIIVGALL
jgi:hypothetical protein